MSNNVEALLRGWGLTDTPEEFSDGIHSWRCEHPARYRRCTCFQEAVSELSELIRKEREEAWSEGRNSADVEYEHIFNGHPVPEGEMCEECEELGRNPYRKE